MFEVGFQELVLIALLALVVLGPEKLPKLAAKLGRWTGRARSMARNLRQQLEQEVSYEELLQQKQAAEEALRKANAAPMEFHHELSETVAPAAAEPSPPALQVDTQEAEQVLPTAELPPEQSKHVASSSS
jgi:sec-independent protein translocase protein TatB